MRPEPFPRRAEDSGADIVGSTSRRNGRRIRSVLRTPICSVGSSKITFPVPAILAALMVQPRIRLVMGAGVRLNPHVQRDLVRGVTTPREAEGVGRTNAVTRPKGRGGGGACSGCPSGWLKVVAVVFTRLVNTPATLGNRGGWFVFNLHNR